MPGPGIRGMTLALAHRPLQEEWAQKLLFVMSVGYDANIEKLVQGKHDTMPIAAATPTALQYTGADRLILRGLTESDDSYAARQQRALDDWGLAGNAWSVLAQIRGYVLASQPRAMAVSTSWLVNVAQSSQWDVLADAAPLTSPPTHSTYDSGGVGNWDWDSLSPTNGSWGWWRWYLVLDYQDLAGNAWIGPAPKFGATSYKVGACPFAIGVNVSSNIGKSLIIITRQWKAHWCHWIIVSFDGALFDPAQPAGGGINPDGYFGRWSKLSGGVYVRARFSDARYCEGPL